VSLVRPVSVSRVSRSSFRFDVMSYASSGHFGFVGNADGPGGVRGPKHTGTCRAHDANRRRPSSASREFATAKRHNVFTSSTSRRSVHVRGRPDFRSSFPVSNPTEIVWSCGVQFVIRNYSTKCVRTSRDDGMNKRRTID